MRLAYRKLILLLDSNITHILTTVWMSRSLFMGIFGQPGSLHLNTHTFLCSLTSWRVFSFMFIAHQVLLAELYNRITSTFNPHWYQWHNLAKQKRQQVSLYFWIHNERNSHFQLFLANQSCGQEKNCFADDIFLPLSPRSDYLIFLRLLVWLKSSVPARMATVHCLR